jgi:hypothetical protein
MQIYDNVKVVNTVKNIIPFFLDFMGGYSSRAHFIFFIFSHLDCANLLSYEGVVVQFSSLIQKDIRKIEVVGKCNFYLSPYLALSQKIKVANSLLDLVVAKPLKID